MGKQSAAFKAYDFTRFDPTRPALKARELVHEFGLHKDFERPIDLMPILRPFDLRLETNLPSTTWGFALDVGPKIIVAINGDLPIDYQRYVAAHEVGHVSMWHKSELNTCVAECQPEETYNQLEHEATAVAAILLIPRLTLLTEVVFGTTDASSLAKRLCVPPELVGIRRELYELTNF